MTAKEVKAKKAELQERKAELEELLEKGDDRAIRMELAAVSEDLNRCNRELRQLMPNHRISQRSTYGTNGDAALRRDLYTKWFQTEYNDGGTTEDERGRYFRSVKAATMALSEKQAKYLEDHLAGMKSREIAEKYGVHKSSVSKGLLRAKRTVDLYASAIEVFDRHDGIDLGDEECLAKFLSLLTEKQIITISLYYGEWMTTREIGDLLGVDKSSVLRSIQRGLYKLGICTQDHEYSASMDMDLLEDLLMAHYNGLEIPTQQQPPKPSKNLKKYSHGEKCSWGDQTTKQGRFYASAKAILFEWMQTCGAVAGTKLFRNPELMSGKFRQWLQGMKASAEVENPISWASIIQATLFGICFRIKEQMRVLPKPLSAFSSINRKGG